MKVGACHGSHTCQISRDYYMCMVAIYVQFDNLACLYIGIVQSSQRDFFNMAQRCISVIESNSEGEVTEVTDRSEEYNSQKDVRAC